MLAVGREMLNICAMSRLVMEGGVSGCDVLRVAKCVRISVRRVSRVAAASAPWLARSSSVHFVWPPLVRGDVDGGGDGGRVSRGESPR
jgi:hypothetical protein